MAGSFMMICKKAIKGSKCSRLTLPADWVGKEVTAHIGQCQVATKHEQVATRNLPISTKSVHDPVKSQWGVYCGGPNYCAKLRKASWGSTCACTAQKEN